MDALTDEDLARAYIGMGPNAPVHVNAQHVAGLRRVVEAARSAEAGGFATRDLLAEADLYSDALIGGESENWLAVVGLVGRLASALRAATAEMHARELHHFETEKMLATQPAARPLPTREQLRLLLQEHGLTDGPGDIHSWRCAYPEVYGACNCFDALLDELVALIEGPSGKASS